MKALLVRVAADLSKAGGSWNGPVNSTSGEFAYVAIPEPCRVHDGLEKPYLDLTRTLRGFGVSLPKDLRRRMMHLDPDFDHLTYGDQGERAKQLRAYLNPGDFIVFYGAFQDIHDRRKLVYAIMGLFIVEKFVLAVDVAARDRDVNAHSRRVLKREARDLIVYGRPGVSGRLRRCIPIGEYRNRAYRVRKNLLTEWGGLSVKDGYIQRSARLPRFNDPARFQRWLDRQHPELIQSNN
jgi:hypothetical protein